MDHMTLTCGEAPLPCGQLEQRTLTYTCNHVRMKIHASKFKHSLTNYKTMVFSMAWFGCVFVAVHVVWFCNTKAFLQMNVQTGPSDPPVCQWSPNTDANCAYIQMLADALDNAGVNYGTYTSEYMWGNIAGSSCTSASDHPLWYAGWDGQQVSVSHVHEHICTHCNLNFCRTSTTFLLLAGTCTCLFTCDACL